jgi:hypothetical protein
MTSSLAAKLDFVLKALSMSRGRLAAELGVDKSAVGRWVSGTATPSAHNLSSLTALVSRRAPGFTGLDWERDLDGLAEAIGVAAPGRPRAAPGPPTLSIPLLEESLAGARLRGRAYEGFYRTTRPYAQQPGQFIHDCARVRMEPDGFPELIMNAGGVMVQGKVLPLQNQLFFVGAELVSAAFVFAIFNGVSTLQAGMIDGLILFCALDPGRTPTATPAVFERIGDLSGDRDADDAKFRELAKQVCGLASETSAPERMRRHLARDVGPAQLAQEGDWLLRLPLVRSWARGLTPLADEPAEPDLAANDQR